MQWYKKYANVTKQTNKTYGRVMIHSETPNEVNSYCGFKKFYGISNKKYKENPLQWTDIAIWTMH